MKRSSCCTPRLRRGAAGHPDAGRERLRRLDAIDGEMLNAPVVLVVSGAERNVLDRLDSQRIHGIVKKPFDPLEIAAIVFACAEIRGNRAFETMAIATVMTGAQLIALWKL